MNPLSNSFANGSIEDDLRRMLVELYQQDLAETADTINVYGAPHIGPYPLVQRSVAQDGLAVLRRADEASIRYLFKAWKFRNPRRGLHFLRTYLQVLYGGNYTVDQLWQPLGMPYPSGLATQDEIVASGASESDYFLTSRLRVELDTDELPSRLVGSIKSVVPARFLVNVRVIRRTQADMGFASVAGVTARLQGAGGSMSMPVRANAQFSTAGRAVTTSMLIAKGES